MVPVVMTGSLNGKLPTAGRHRFIFNPDVRNPVQLSQSQDIFRASHETCYLKV